MKSAVVYYSLEGNTDHVAGVIKEKTGCDILRLDVVRQYPDKGFRKFLWGGKSAVMAESPKLLPYEFNADEYDQIIFGFPVWAGTFAPPLRSFIKENDFSGKHLSAYACQSGAGGEKALDKLEELLGRKLEHRLVLVDPKDRPDENKRQALEAFIKEL
ncbi:MAG: hypothetical protein IKE38_04055 [Erysipelotrichaceae bacterium]|nr:hypothetical protein [Erysipelotrichaceae bacterium]